MDKYIFQVKGMHCKACVALTESELAKGQGVTKVRSDLGSKSVAIEGDFGGRDKEEIAGLLNPLIKSFGYSLEVGGQASGGGSVKDFYIAIPIALVLIILFIWLQKLGLVNLIGSGKLDYGSIFIIGLVASISSCMAVVGGLVLSVSASFARDGSKVKPQAMFHVGRIISFFFLGGLTGLIGSALQLGGTGSFILSLLVALIMLILGLNLLDIFPWASRLQPAMPKFLGKKIHALKDASHSLTPFILGAATFFLPCGFTQSMQVYSLSTGSFWSGAGTMLVFAMGTLPVLLILSFGSSVIGQGARARLFFRTAGLVVIFMAIFNLLNALAGVGIISPVINF